MREYRYRNKLSRKNQFARLGWDLCYAVLFRSTPRWTLFGWRNSVLRAFGARVGKGCRIDPRARIWAPWNLEIGDLVAIAEGVELYNVDQITIGSKVTISQRAFLCTASHDISSLLRPLVYAPILICDHAWIAAEAMLHPGVVVEEGSVIAARAVLRNRAPAWTIWAGNPAREIGSRKLKAFKLDEGLDIQEHRKADNASESDKNI